MRRADRLFELIQILRRAKKPLTAETLAARLETSRWTVYRDIAALVAQRVPIQGEAGIGFVLGKGFDLPPLMLTADEIEAVALGSQWVASHADAGLARSAREVLGKLSAIVPERARDLLDNPAVATPEARGETRVERVDIGRVREWVRRGLKLAIVYEDGAGRRSERTIWPFLVGYATNMRIVAAWCELRRDFRMFRTERLITVHFLEEPYATPRAALRERWLERMEDPGD